MAEYKPNPQQEKFLSASGCNVLVSASAGSGKTSTMIQKLAGIITKEKAPISTLLVVTYTNAAASEIKLKLFNELSKLIGSTTNECDRAFLQSSIENINNAEIGTLHAICKKLIVKYFYKLEISPDFDLLSDKESKYLLDTAINNVFEKHIATGDDDFFELYDCYNSKRNDSRLKSMCLSLYNFKCAKIGYTEWKNDFLNSSYIDDLKSNIAGTYILEHYRKSFLRYSSQIMSLKAKANELNLPQYADFMASRMQFVDEICKVDSFESAIKVLANLELIKKPSKSRNADVDEVEFDEEVAIFHKFFTDTLKKFKEDVTFDDIEKIKKSIISSRQNVEKLMSIVDEIDNQYSAIKNSRNTLDFNDLEEKMLQLLEDNEVRETLKKQYSYIFVDEYQDINDKQESILLSLVSGNNYYMIGDVKQSIYAFRQSSPKIFISKYNQFSSDNVANKLINFNANYRSDRNILEVANSVFDNIITRDTIGIDYAGDARFESEKAFAGCNTTLNIIDGNEELDDKEKTECLVIAKEILRLINEKRPDGSKYEYKDIAIILRSRGTFVRTLTDMLTSMQIPVSTSINSDFFNTSEVQLLISILKVLSNYQDDISMAIVLKNLFDVSEQELLNIRKFDDNLPFYECVREYSGDEEIVAKINKLFEFIKESRIQLLTMTINEYLIRLVDRFDIIQKIKVLDNGREKESNIREFLAISDNENYQYNLDKFLEYLEFIGKETSLQHLGVDSNAVEICTIHHSKGLEYPIVILGGLGRNFQLNKDSGDIIISGKFGVGLKSIDNISRELNETIIRNACKLDNSRGEIDEEIRLLYVAMTRAKEKLSMVGVYNLANIETQKRKGVYQSRNYFDLLFKSIENVYMSSFLNKNQFQINEGKSSALDVNIFHKDDFEEDKIKEKTDIILDALDEEIINKLSNVYKNAPSIATTTIKNTVTNILREESDYENLNSKPKRLDAGDYVENNDALKVGTAYHSVMQVLKFTEDKGEIEGIISRLVADNKIEKDVSKYIEVDKIFKAKEVLKDWILGADKVYREKQFLLCENYNKLVTSTDNNTKVIVQGVIDLVVVTGNNVYLIDYKTNRGVSAEQLAEEYRLQLKIYAHAFQCATGISVTKCYLYSFHMGKLIEIDV